MKNKHWISLVLLCLTLVFALGCASLGQDPQSFISVIATGSVMAQPDTIQMVILLAETAPTTRQAQEVVNAKVRDALTVLKNAEIADKDISTASLRFSPEYDWQEGGRTLLGQRAEQTISFSISDIKSDNEKISRIIDSLIQINGIELQNFTFSVKESAELFARSRELAYQKALEKAEQFAELSGQRVVRAMTINEEGPRYVAAASNVMRNQSNMLSLSAAAEDSSSSVVPSGAVEISSTIFVSFLVE